MQTVMFKSANPEMVNRMIQHTLRCTSTTQYEDHSLLHMSDQNLTDNSAVQGAYSAITRPHCKYVAHAHYTSPTATATNRAHKFHPQVKNLATQGKGSAAPTFSLVLFPQGWYVHLVQARRTTIKALQVKAWQKTSALHGLP